LPLNNIAPILVFKGIAEIPGGDSRFEIPDFLYKTGIKPKGA